MHAPQGWGMLSDFLELSLKMCSQLLWAEGLRSAQAIVSTRMGGRCAV